MKILISGYHGFANTGDEAVLQAIIEGVRARVPEPDICVLSADPEATAAEYGVRTADRWKHGAIWQELRWADFLIQGGGSLLQDITSRHSALYYLGVLQMARMARTPYMIFAQGVGPLRSRFLQALTARNLRQARAITVRDEGSAHLLQEWGVRKPEIHVTADPGLLVASADAPRRAKLMKSLDLDADHPYMCIALREWPGLADFLPHLVELLQTRDEALLVLPFQFEEDLPLALDLSHALPNRVHLPDRTLHPADYGAVIQGARALIAMRLHAMIFAASQGTPALALSYDPKVDAFCHSAGQPVLQFSEVTVERLEECLQECLSMQNQAECQTRVARLRVDAEHNFDVLMDVLPTL
jgi:polysaccharide pyruvyl transferase CsaB